MIPDNKYVERIPIQTGTLVTDKLVSIMTVEELQQADETWEVDTQYSTPKTKHTD